MKTLLCSLALLFGCALSAPAVEYQAFRATVTLPFVNSSFVDDTDRFINTRVSNKQLINLARGQSFKAKVPRELVLVVLFPSNTSPFSNGSLVILDTKAQTVSSTIATLTPSSVLTPDDLTKPSVALERLSFGALANATFHTSAFTLNGSAMGAATANATPPVYTLKIVGLKGSFSRNDPQLSIYAGVVTKASVRVSGKPIATLDL